MGSSFVRYELDGHVATITYDRPDALNTINGAMRRDLNAAFDRFRTEEDAWIAIVECTKVPADGLVNVATGAVLSTVTFASNWVAFPTRSTLPPGPCPRTTPPLRSRR